MPLIVQQQKNENNSQGDSQSCKNQCSPTAEWSAIQGIQTLLRLLKRKWRIMRVVQSRGKVAKQWRHTEGFLDTKDEERK